jgi:integrase
MLEHSPADYVRRLNVPSESPTLGLSHLQFEALLSAARQSANINDFALVAMLGLLGLRIFEATGTNIEDVGEEHGHRVLRVFGKGNRVTLMPLPPAVGERSTVPLPTERAARFCSMPAGPEWIVMPPPDGCTGSPTSWL